MSPLGKISSFPTKLTSRNSFTGGLELDTPSSLSLGFMEGGGAVAGAVGGAVAGVVGGAVGGVAIVGGVVIVVGDCRSGEEKGCGFPGSVGVETGVDVGVVAEEPVCVCECVCVLCVRACMCVLCMGVCVCVCVFVCMCVCVHVCVLCTCVWCMCEWGGACVCTCV